MTRARIPLLALCLTVLASALPLPARAGRGGEPTYPKVATYVYQVGQFTPAQRETLSWFDLVTCMERPDVIADMRARNPHQRILHRSMPQIIEGDNEDQTFWYPDTAWCLLRLCQYYAMQNDWYLYDTSGQRISEWSGYVANWTRYCPRGTYGNSRGMTYAEWYINVALPQMAYHSPIWQRWGWGSSAYDGIAWEVFNDCPACCESGKYRDADPDRDGLAEGIQGTCWDGGDQDSLSILWHETNDIFRARMPEVLEPDLVININRGGAHLNPTWAWELNGLKLEDWRPIRTNPAKSWWSWMYGRRSAWEFIGDGYQFAERYMHPTEVDSLDGWDMSWLMVWTRGATWDPSYKQRMQRWGLGTTMLGDGYFIFTYDQHRPTWLSQFDWDFGRPLEDYQRQLFGADTLYVRRFEKGFVEVNPYPRVVNQVPAEDTRFAFWLTLSGVAVDSVGEQSVSLGWVVPAGWSSANDRFEVRYALTPITAENWGAATPGYTGPLTGEPGEHIQCPIIGLAPATRYYFAVRNSIYNRYDPAISNLVTATTEEAPGQGSDEIRPAPVTDLTAPERGSSWARLAWSATGDDSLSGTADHYLVRRLAGRDIASESDWAQATPVAGDIPSPGAPGTRQEMRVDGLNASSTYGFAVRVVDEADNLSALSNPLLVTTLPPSDTTYPSPIRDLRADSLLTDGFLLRWTATGDDGTTGTATSYVLGYRPGTTITTESAWTQAEKVTAGLPAPAPAGASQTWQLSGLTPGTAYGLAIRAYDDAGHLSGLGNSPLLTTLIVIVPDTIPPAPITQLAATGVASRSADLRWVSTGDDGATGRATRFVLGYLEGGGLAGEADWKRAHRIEEGLPAPGNPGESVDFRLGGLTPERSYAIAVRAYDDADLLSALGATVVVTTAALPDTLAPAAIADLRSPRQAPNWCDLAWSATGDDDLTGAADHYELRWLAGRAIDDETDWLAAQPAAGDLPRPGAPGAPESFRLTGLAPTMLYGVAVRAFDEAGNRSALSNALIVRTLDPPDTVPPSHVPDLFILSSYEDGFDLAWTAPGDDGMRGTASVYVLGHREGQAIDGEARWSEAVRETLVTPLPAPAGTRQSCRVRGLRSDTVYGLALRAIDDAGLCSALPAPGPVGRTARRVEPAPDEVPPATIGDLALISAGQTSLALAWSAPGDDGVTGTAHHFELAWIAGTSPIESETDWAAATRVVEGLPVPPAAGTRVAWTLTGLAPGTSYALSVRAYDEAGNGAALSNPLIATTTAVTPPPPPPPDTTPPAAIADLTVAGMGESWARLEWTAPGDDGSTGRAASFILGWIEGAGLTDEPAWQRAAKITDGLPEPGNAGATASFVLDGLEPGRVYSVAVRACDDAGLLSPLGPPASFETPDAADRVPPGGVADLSAVVSPDGTVRLRWTAAGDDGASGAAARLIVAARTDQMIETETDWLASSLDTLENATAGGAPDSLARGPFEPGSAWGFALRYCDETGAAGPISNFAAAFIPAAPDTDRAPLAAVTGLRVTALDPGEVTLYWEPAEEAAGYVVALLAGDRIHEADWASAARESVAVPPVAQRGEVSHVVTGLVAGESYGLAVRATDEAGNLSPLGEGLWIPAFAPGPALPAAIVSDLRATPAGPDRIDLAWTAPSGGASSVEAYEIVWDDALPTAADWPGAARVRPGRAPAAPGEPESAWLSPLAPGRSYWIAVRAYNGLGLWSEFSPPIGARIRPPDALAPDAPVAPSAVVDPGGETVTVSWPASPESDVAGYHVFGRRDDTPEPTRLTATPVVATHWSFPTPAGCANFLVSVAAIDSAGNQSERGEETPLFAEAIRLDGPFPHPIEEEARFTLALPPSVEGSAPVSARIFTVAGVLVRRWIDERMPAGPIVTLRWDTRGDGGLPVAPGLYLLKLEAAGQTLIRKIYVNR
jgi:hypothetical protein